MVIIHTKVNQRPFAEDVEVFLEFFHRLDQDALSGSLSFFVIQ